MIRRCLLALGWSCLLGACGSKFSAGDGAGGISAELGGAGAEAAGSGAGDASGARGGDEPSGDAGTDSGGTEAFGGAAASGSSGATAGTGSGNGGASAGGGPVLGHGGTSGSAGAGGGVEQPTIPRLGLLLWLRADVGVQQTGGLVQAWLDQSGNQLNASQTGNACPRYVAKGLNGLPALKFDGAAQFLKLPEGFTNFRQGLAGFMVLQPAASACASALELSNGSEADDIAFGMYQDKWTYEVENPLIQTGSVDLLAPSLYGANHTPDTVKDTDMVDANADLRINGSVLQSLTMAVPKMIVRRNNFVGHTLYQGCNYFEGMISEIILYQRTVTPEEVKSIESYLSKHWNLGAVAAP